MFFQNPFDIPALHALGSSPDPEELRIARKQLELAEDRALKDNLEDFGKGIKAVREHLKDKKDRSELSKFEQEASKIVQSKGSVSKKMDKLEKLRQQVGGNVSIEAREGMDKSLNNTFGRFREKQSAEASEESLASARRSRELEEATESAKIAESLVKDPSELAPGDVEGQKANEQFTRLAQQSQQQVADIIQRRVAQQRKHENKLREDIDRGDIDLPKLNEANNRFEEMKLQKTIGPQDIDDLNAKMDASILTQDPEQRANLKIRTVARELAIPEDELVGRIVGANPDVKNIVDAEKAIQSYFKGKASQGARTIEMFGRLPDVDPKFLQKRDALTNALGIKSQEDLDNTLHKLDARREGGGSSLSELILAMDDERERANEKPGFNRAGMPTGKFILRDDEGKEMSLDELGQSIKALPLPKASNVPQPASQPSQVPIGKQFPQAEQDVNSMMQDLIQRTQQGAADITAASPGAGGAGPKTPQKFHAQLDSNDPTDLANQVLGNIGQAGSQPADISGARMLGELLSGILGTGGKDGQKPLPDQFKPGKTSPGRTPPIVPPQQPELDIEGILGGVGAGAVGGNFRDIGFLLGSILKGFF